MGIVIKFDKYILNTMLLLQAIGIFVTIKIGNEMSLRFQVPYIVIIMKHLIYVLISWIMFYIFDNLEEKNFFKSIWSLFFISVLLTYITAVIGPKINGVRRWLFIAGFCLQSSEFIKNLIAIPINILLSRSQHKKALFLIGISILSTLIQPDLGMSILILNVVGFSVFLHGEYLKKYMISGVFALMGLLLSGIFLAKYSKKRLLIFLGQEKGYQINQSLISIADSSMFTSENSEIYIPDAHCDFMFSALVNKLGFVAGLCIGIVPILLMNHIFSKTKSILILALWWQFTTQFYLHILSNLAMIPTKGFGLPLVSHGGSGMISYGILFGTISNLLRQTKYK